MSRTNNCKFSSSSTMATPTFPSGAASGIEVPLCRCGEIGEGGSVESEGFMGDNESLEGLRRKIVAGQHRQIERLEKDSQGPVFNFCESDIHGLLHLRRAVHVRP